jgi:antitoxin VapB
MTAKAKLFNHDGTQAVALPEAFRFEGSEVLVDYVGEDVVLRPVKSSGDDLWCRIDAIRGDEQLSYSNQPVIRELDFDW